MTVFAWRRVGFYPRTVYNTLMIEIIKNFNPRRLGQQLGSKLSIQWHSRFGKQPPQSGAVVGEYYRRSGACNMCGRCCTNIYLVHEEDTIKTVADFERYQEVEPEFHGFIPIDKDDHGVKFQCKHLKDDKSCAVYADRPSFCRQYPSEKGVLLGGVLADECGYSFEVINKFKDVLAKLSN